MKFNDNIFALRKQHKELLDSADAIVTKAEAESRELSATENGQLDKLMKDAKDICVKIENARVRSTIYTAFGDNPIALAEAGTDRANPMGGERPVLTPEQGRAKAAQYRSEFAAWVNGGLKAIGGYAPRFEATAPSGPISIGTGAGLESIGTTVPLEILPYLPSYFNLDSFGLAGARQIPTDHTRPVNMPIISAGAADSTYAENAAPTSSEPFGLSGFQFGGTKYSRLVLASYESLMNSELPLQGVILDELLATLATTLTTAFTTSLYTALTAYTGIGAGPSALLVTGTDLYQTMIDLRHAVPPRFDLPENKWMLSRASLSKIKNTRASTSGVPMFDPNSNTIFGKEFVVNDNFDAAAAGLVVYGSWLSGAFIRKTPIATRVFVEKYAEQGQIGYRTTQWADSHWLAELAGASQPPTFQPLYYAILP